MKEKMHYLELQSENKFWEMSFIGCETRIRMGKIGKPGRKFPKKTHSTEAGAAKEVRCQVNAKIIQGYIDPAEVTQETESPPKQISRKKSMTVTPPPRKPLKKSSTVRRLAKQNTVTLGTSVSTGKVTPKWRKPHKKQSTIRRMVSSHTKKVGRQVTLSFSTPSRSEVQDSTKNGDTDNTVLSLQRQDTIAPPESNSQNNKQETAQKGRSRRSMTKMPTLAKEETVVLKPSKSSLRLRKSRSKMPSNLSFYV